METPVLNPRGPNAAALLPEMVKNRFADAFDNPVFLMGCPAFALLAFDNDAKAWMRSPLSVWTRCADEVGWNGVLPADRVYGTGSTGSVTCMVAIKTSPIWKLLSDTPAGSESLPPNVTVLLSNVGKREWCHLCDSAGIPHGLDIAKAVIAAQASIGGKGRYGASSTPAASSSAGA